MNHQQAIPISGDGTKKEKDRQDNGDLSTRYRMVHLSSGSSLHYQSSSTKRLLDFGHTIAQAKLSNPRSSERLLSQVASNNRPRPATSHTGSGHTPTTHPSTPSASSYSGSLGYLNVDHHSTLPVPHTHTVRDTSAEDFATVKITMAGLGIELPDQVIATLARKHDGMTPMERFLSEEGHWVPDSRSQGNHYKGGSQGGR